VLAECLAELPSDRPSLQLLRAMGLLPPLDDDVFDDDLFDDVLNTLLTSLLRLLCVCNVVSLLFSLHLR